MPDMLDLHHQLAVALLEIEELQVCLANACAERDDLAAQLATERRQRMAGHP